MIQNSKDFKLGAGLALFCLLYLFVLTPWQVGKLTEEAALLPIVISTFLFLLSLLLMAQSMRKKADSTAHSSTPKRFFTITAVSFVMITYAWLLEKTGFLLTSAVAMMVLFRIFGVKNYWKTAAITFITLLFLYVSFENLLYAPLPVGSLWEFLLD